LLVNGIEISMFFVKKDYRVLELKNKPRAFLSSSRLELLEYSEQPYQFLSYYIRSSEMTS